MENLPIFALTVALLALGFLYLSANVVRLRLRHRVALGHDGHDDLHHAIRAQANFTEYTYMAIFLLFILALMGVNLIYYSLLCLALLIGRATHGYGLLVAEQKDKPNIRPRQIGFQLSVGVIGLSALTVLILLIV